ETRRLSSQLSRALMQQRGMVSEKDYQATLKDFTSRINQLRSEVNATNQQMRQIPRYRGRFVNNLVAEQYAELMVYRNQLQAKLEKQDSADEAGDATASPVRTPRRLPSGKRSRKAAAGPAAPGGSF